MIDQISLDIRAANKGIEVAPGVFATERFVIAGGKNRDQITGYLYRADIDEEKTEYGYCRVDMTHAFMGNLNAVLNYALGDAYCQVAIAMRNA